MPLDSLVIIVEKYSDRDAVTIKFTVTDLDDYTVKQRISEKITHLLLKDGKPNG